jgi:hypothetical protein
MSIPLIHPTQKLLKQHATWMYLFLVGLYHDKFLQHGSRVQSTLYKCQPSGVD